jgi:broad specificity phosphatase PhoE
LKIGLTLALLATAALAGCAAVPATLNSARTVYVTRHMQKAPDGSDPALSAEGAVNADRLAEALADKGVVAIFATPTRRAMETAAPLARRTGIEVTAYDPRDPQALAAAVAAAPGSVLVVGHSNTVADLVSRFGGRNPPAPLSEDDYGRVFVIDAEGAVEAFELG